jgi:hypothetical protein
MYIVVAGVGRGPRFVLRQPLGPVPILHISLRTSTCLEFAILGQCLHIYEATLPKRVRRLIQTSNDLPLALFLFILLMKEHCPCLN